MKPAPRSPAEAVAALAAILSRRTGEPAPTTPEALRVWLEARPADWAWAVGTRPHLTVPAGIGACPGVIDRLRSSNLPLDPRSHAYLRLVSRLEGVGPAEARLYLADLPGHCAALLELLEGQGEAG